MSGIKLGQNNDIKRSYEELVRATAEAHDRDAIYGIGGLRDQIAMSALRGLLNNESNPKDAKAFATDAYRFADAMLEARKVKP